MTSLWKEVLISKIYMAVYVAKNHGKHIHKNRDFHGFVLNDADCVRNYIFSDGTVLNTVGGSFFYLPKGCSYHVETVSPGGCHCINFDADIVDEPFVINFRNYDGILHNFKSAVNAWIVDDELKHSSSMRALYDAIYQMQKELRRQYMPDSYDALIGPAIKKMDVAFTDNELSIEVLARDCGVSSVYFRKIFMNRFGTSPKSYLIKKRLEYAQRLLSSKSLSVSEVALQCGYTEACHFSREFKKRFGISPKQLTEQSVDH